jgi:hypothetical protein
MFYNIIQSKFKNNKNNCWFAGALCSYSNNVIHKQITDQELRDIEEQAYSTFVMPQRWLTLKGGIQRIGEITKSRTLIRKWFDDILLLYLNKWMVVCVAIEPTDTFVKQRKSDSIITGGEWKPLSTGHIVCLAKRDWKYYIINSREWTVYKEVSSIDVFKTRDWRGVLLPN